METQVDEELLDELVNEGNKLQIKNMIDMKVIDVVKRPSGTKVTGGRWVLRRKVPDCVRARYVTKEIAST